MPRRPCPCRPELRPILARAARTRRRGMCSFRSPTTAWVTSITEYTVNALNQIVQVVHAAASTDSAVPPFGYLEQFAYDANNNVTQHRTERRDDGALTSPSPVRWITKGIAYDSLDREISETISTDDVPAISLTTSYAYDNNGNLRKTVFPAGNAILRFCDERDLLTREVVLKNASSDLTDMTYNASVDSVTQYDYDGSGNVIQLTDPEGHMARSGYDGYGRKVVGFDPAFQKTTLVYDQAGNVLSRVAYGALGGATPAPSIPPSTQYPELSRQMGRVRRADTRFFKYDGTMLTPLTSDSNAGLGTTAAGDPLPQAHDGWTTSLVGYDRLGRVVRAVDDNGHATETRYDGLNRRIKSLMNVAFPFTLDSANPLNNRNAVDYLYDANGNVTEVTETEYGADRTGGSPRLFPSPQQHRSTFKYDSMNRPFEAKMVGRLGATPANLITTSVYDSRGNKIQVTDPAGGRSKKFYDGLNRLTKTEAGYFWNGSAESVPSNLINTSNPDGKITTTYSYDSNSRLTAVQDDNLRVTSFAYDNLNRQTRIIYPDASTLQVTYNKDSLETEGEHRDNQGYRIATTTQYDCLHRATEKTVDKSGAPWFVGSMRQAFEYDGQSRITRALDDEDLSDGFVDSEVALSYNSAGNVLSEAQTWRENIRGQFLTGTNIVTSQYEGTGFRASVTYPSLRTITFLADELNRSESIVDSYTGTIKYDYLGPSRILNRIYPNGTRLTMLSSPTDNVGAGYDDARRLVDFANKLNSTGADVARFTYGYDNVGNRRFERRVHEASGSNWKGETYAYDAVYRLINRKEGDLNASGVLQGTAPTTQDFTLDGLGNWKSHKKNSSTYNQTINSLNQYTVFNGPTGSRSLTYDFVGNLVQETLATGDQQYHYDFLNRLVTYLDTGRNLTTYRYDALGRRISKNLNGGTHTRFVYDGDRLIEERDETNTLVASYVYGLGSDEVLTRRRWSGGVASDLFYHTNALGSVMAVTSTAGAVVERYKYDAYGQVTFLSPTFTPLTSSAVYNNLLFTGRYFDSESQLYYYRARHYSPSLGRFLQRDPLGEVASLNLYNYVFNNPVNGTDPTGMVYEGGGFLVQRFGNKGPMRDIEARCSRLRTRCGSCMDTPRWKTSTKQESPRERPCTGQVGTLRDRRGETPS
ncbi:MAG: RHS repeat-associated core domain-containing protein [Candidatus Eisenbacteria bacterium]|uniref:RHS repeat-associated core domain-containing protein n=1 Tax=Eiseniibacteriota bacterium TaxID=2212470 RepID=A0A538TC82_UNCEI|nr:MAG: RHS repeat-associated core domain-containing protein [Candidatus Eisenbacteria bacterium]